MDFSDFDGTGNNGRAASGGFGGFHSWLGGPGMLSNQTFEEHFRCYPVIMMDSPQARDNASYGGKLILPPSALDKLTRLNIMYPMLFELEAELPPTAASAPGDQSGPPLPTVRRTNAGVLEFTAEEGRAYLPQWMMQSLGIEPGAIVKITNTSLPLGRFVKIQPQSVDFLDISDPRAVLENALRHFATLTEGDTITISYNAKLYDIKVLETKPAGKGICIVETDLEVDFAAPVGYVEP
ncbi:ubiquitin fusion degradation protein UFD1, partial [Dimargaris cristalligena]